MNNTTRLQLIDGPQVGYLDVKEGVSVPLNFSVSDIRDISSRSGMFSKTIALAGTKNNNNILNNYFDVNIKAGTFDVNKRQKVAIVQNGIILRDNCFMRLLKVKKKQSVDTNVDEWVEYEVQVTDELGDFFKEVGNKEVKELDGWDKYKHIYGVDAVVDSFDHTVDDGYKYTLPFISDNQFVMNDLMPGVYAKQVFDRIHSQNGFSYEWATIADDDTQFDKSILPYAGDKKKLTEDYIDSVEVIAGKGNQDIGAVLIGGQTNKYSTSVLEADNVLKDNEGWYNSATSEYHNTYTLSPPNKLNYKITFEWKVEMINRGSEQVRMGEDNVLNPPGTINESNTGARPRVGVKLGSNILNYADIENPVFANFSGMTGSDAPLNGEPMGSVRQINGVNYLTTRGRVLLNGNETKELCSGSQTSIVPITSIDLNDILVGFKDIRVIVGSPNPFFWFETGSGQGAEVEYKFTISKLEINIAPDSQNGLMPGTEIDIKNFLPNKMKQSEFLKTIYQKYNLYVETDPDNPSKLIYTSRDKFYDDGEVKDWTEKLDKKREQELYFIPDITTKKMILSYKDDDKDALLDAYRGETSKTFGQVDVTFDNENIKGEERKDEVFSPTINMMTDFGAVLPVLNADFKMNPRILQDGGKLPCGEFSLKESDSKTVTSSFYPHLSMFDKPFNPTFSTEYAQSSFYAYNPGLFTENNLYNSHWRRTLAQINSGKMLKAWFWLTEEDIQSLKMNDKIKVNNTYYYINAVIDYDANSNSVTKVELLTVEDDLKLPRVGGGIKDIETIGEVVSGVARPKVPSIPGGFFIEAISQVIKKRYDENVVTSGPVPLTGNLGMGNKLPLGFKGLIIGDGITPDNNGVYVGDNSMTDDGIKLNSIELPGFSVSQNGEISFDSSSIINGLDYLPLTGGTLTGPLTLDDVGTTTPVGNLGYDANGNVVQGINPTTVNSLNILDTRNDNEDPLWYLTNYGRKNVIELKRKTMIGLATLLPTGTFCSVETICQWLDGSGGFPIQIARDPNTGDVAKRWGIDDTTWSSWILEGGKLSIVPILYTDLKTLKDNNNLVTGTRYFISDRDIWIDAIDTDKLSMSAKRHFRIVKDEFYTPHTLFNGIFTSNYLGIYGQTIAKGSVPNSVQISNRYYAIWGGRMWIRDTTGSDTPGSSNVTIGGGWTMLVTTNNTYYESKIFDIKYDFDDDIIWEQSDDRGNIIKRQSSTSSNIDITDWGNENIYDNENFGIFNNFYRTLGASSEKAKIFRNTNRGSIYRNVSADIDNNSNLGNISDNIFNGVQVYIGYNSNAGSIDGNILTGNLTSNSNAGSISENSGFFIMNNSNRGGIYNNTINSRIEKNSNSGNIHYNSTSAGGGIFISQNSNNGGIGYNNSTNSGTIYIRYNTNNGYIGSISGPSVNRSTSIQDPIVDK